MMKIKCVLNYILLSLFPLPLHARVLLFERISIFDLVRMNCKAAKRKSTNNHKKVLSNSHQIKRLINESYSILSRNRYFDFDLSFYMVTHTHIYPHRFLILFCLSLPHTRMNFWFIQMFIKSIFFFCSGSDQKWFTLSAAPFFFFVHSLIEIMISFPATEDENDDEKVCPRLGWEANRTRS